LGSLLLWFEEFSGACALPVLIAAYAMFRTGARRRPNLARPYIARFSILIRLIWPSTGFVVHGNTSAALISPKSRRRLAAIDFLLSAKRDAEAAKRFFRKALAQPHTVNPHTITVDKNAAYPKAAAEMKNDGEL
jgi:hypothetical protein